eukprot:5865924-Alexandrium_andersonii.AAC.1
MRTVAAAAIKGVAISGSAEFSGAGHPAEAGIAKPSGGAEESSEGHRGPQPKGQRRRGQFGALRQHAPAWPSTCSCVARLLH